ncbi:MAG: nuclear transport factor 2 family protein [candidate division Zixibacteria bacterium]
MKHDDLVAISHDLQKAFDSKDIEKVMEYYHPEIVLISPSYPKPIIGIDSLKEAISTQFKSPRRTSVTLKEIKAYPITDEVHSVICEVSGHQSIYYSDYQFKGLISRIFISAGNGPKIIAEHFSLFKE